MFWASLLPGTQHSTEPMLGVKPTTWELKCDLLELHRPWCGVNQSGRISLVCGVPAKQGCREKERRTWNYLTFDFYKRALKWHEKNEKCVDFPHLMA